MPLLYAVVTLLIVGAIAWFANMYRPMPLGIRRILNVVVGLIVVGIVLWLINSYIPMAESIKAILNIVVVIATCVGVLQAFGLWGNVVRFWDNLTSHRFSH